MKFPRRQFLHLAVSAAAFPLFPRGARAQSYPTRPVRIIVGFAAGGTIDIVARVIGQWLSERLGQQFVMENRTGASGNIGTEAVAQAPADGHTLLGVAPANATNGALFEKLSFDFNHDIAPVAGVIRVPNVMEVNPSFPAQTVPEFIAYAKSNPGKVNYASSGSGTPQHLCAELFKGMTGIEMTHVPYRGNALALTDLLGGRFKSCLIPCPTQLVTSRLASSDHWP
jgi:tripartite-type tricarboxylate transporter receptor subunit TctC